MGSVVKVFQRRRLKKLLTVGCRDEKLDQYYSTWVDEILLGVESSLGVDVRVDEI